MATVFDNKPTYTPSDREAALHNARIKERYEQLKNAEASQLAESISAAERTVFAPPAEPETEKRPFYVPDDREIAARFFPQESASVSAPERPKEREYAGYEQPSAREKVPQTPEFVHTKVDSPLFTPEMLDRTIRREYYDFASAETVESVGRHPVADMQTAGGAAAVRQPMEMPARTERAMPVSAVGVAEEEESYSLNAFAVKMAAAFAALVILLLSVIGINSRVIRQKTRRLNDLEEKRAELAEQNAELEQRIKDATDFERVLEYVEEHGMIPSGD